MDDSTFMALFFWGAIAFGAIVSLVAHLMGLGHIVTDDDDPPGLYGAGESPSVSGGRYGLDYD